VAGFGVRSRRSSSTTGPAAASRRAFRAQPRHVDRMLVVGFSERRGRRRRTLRLPGHVRGAQRRTLIWPSDFHARRRRLRRAKCIIPAGSTSPPELLPESGGGRPAGTKMPRVGHLVDLHPAASIIAAMSEYSASGWCRSPKW
jgi:hypothetical protein